MRSARRALLVLACLAAPLSALAQGNTDPGHEARGQTPPEMVAPRPNNPQGPTGTGSQLTGEEAQNELRHLERNAQPGGPVVRVGELRLVSGTGERLGAVEDVMLDAEGQLAGYVVETGGVLGIGERHLFVPREAVRLERNADGRMVLRTDQQLTTFQAASRARP